MPGERGASTPSGSTRESGADPPIGWCPSLVVRWGVPGRSSPGGTGGRVEFPVGRLGARHAARGTAALARETFQRLGLEYGDVRSRRRRRGGRPLVGLDSYVCDRLGAVPGDRVRVEPGPVPTADRVRVGRPARWADGPGPVLPSAGRQPAPPHASGETRPPPTRAPPRRPTRRALPERVPDRAAPAGWLTGTSRAPVAAAVHWPPGRRGDPGASPGGRSGRRGRTGRTAARCRARRGR